MHRDAPAVELQLVRTMPGFTMEDRMVVKALTPSDTGTKFSNAVAQRPEDAELRNGFL